VVSYQALRCPNFARILLLSTALIVSIGTAIAGGRSGERNLMDDYLQSKTSVNSGASSAFSQQSTLINNKILLIIMLFLTYWYLY
jgi:hypothetical protein